MLLNLFYLCQKKRIAKSKVASALYSRQHTFDGNNTSTGSSPTVATRALLLTLVINTYKEHGITTLVIETAFLHAFNNKNIITKLRGKIVKLLVQLKPLMYRKYATTGPNGQPVLYMKLLKALYVFLRLALLLYKKI